VRVLSVGAASFTSHTGYMATETRATTFVTGASRWRWQIAFLVIGSNPRRFRALMIPAITEKFGYVATLPVLYGQERIAQVDAMAAVPDGLLGLLFIVAFVKARPSY